MLLQVGHDAVGIGRRGLLTVETILYAADVVEEVVVRALAVGRLDVVGVGAQVGLSYLLSGHLGTDVAASGHENR